MFTNKLSENKLKIATNTMYQLIAKVFTMAITVLATVMITRAYGLVGYGEFSLMQVWPALFFIIIDFGVNAIATRELSADASKSGHYLGNIIMIRVFFALFFIIVLNVLLSVPGWFSTYSDGLILGIRLSLFLTLMHGLFTSSNIIFQTKLRYDLSALAQISGYIFILAWILITSYFKLHIAWVSFGYVLGGVITFITGMYYVNKLGVLIRFELDTELIKYLMVQSLPLGIMFVFSQLNFKDDSLLLSLLKLPEKYGLDNTQSSGIYNLPYKVFEVALVVPTFFMNAVYPVMVKKHIEGRLALKSVLKKTLGALAFGGIIAGVLGIFFSRFVITILGGTEFTQSILVLQILLGGLVFYFISSPLSWLILTLGKQKYLPFVYFIVAVINFALNLIFIPMYSFYAAAVVTHVSEFLVLIIVGFLAIKSWRDYYAVDIT